MVQKFVHEMTGNVFPRRLLEVADRAQVDRVPFGGARWHDRQRRRRRQVLATFFFDESLVPHHLVQHVMRETQMPENHEKIEQMFNKTSCFRLIEFTTQDYFTKHSNITTKLKLKLFKK